MRPGSDRRKRAGMAAVNVSTKARRSSGSNDFETEYLRGTTQHGDRQERSVCNKQGSAQLTQDWSRDPRSVTLLVTETVEP